VVLMQVAVRAADGAQVRESARKVVALGAFKTTQEAFDEARSLLARGDALLTDLIYWQAVGLHREAKPGDALAKVKQALVLAPSHNSLLAYQAS